MPAAAAAAAAALLAANATVAADAAVEAETVVPDSVDAVVMVLTMAAAATAEDRAAAWEGGVEGGFRGGQHEQRPGKAAREFEDGWVLILKVRS